MNTDFLFFNFTMKYSDMELKELDSLLRDYRQPISNKLVENDHSVERIFNILAKYYEYGNASLLTYNEMYDRWIQLQFKASGGNNNDKIETLQMIASTIPIYTHLRICLAMAKKLNDIIRSGATNDNVTRLDVIAKEREKEIDSFIRKRDKVASHPAGNDMYFLDDASQYGTDGVTFTLFHDDESVEDVIKIDLEPFQDFKMIHDYLEKLIPLYREYYLS
jgi:hypothetical protein